MEESGQTAYDPGTTAVRLDSHRVTPMGLTDGGQGSLEMSMGPCGILVVTKGNEEDCGYQWDSQSWAVSPLHAMALALPSLNARVLAVSLCVGNLAFIW